MIQYSDSAKEYIKRNKQANQETSTRIRRFNTVAVLMIVAVLLVLLTYLPQAMDKTWEQQYEQPMQYYKTIQE